MNRRLLSRPVLVAAVMLLQVVLLVVALRPQLSARLTGTEYRLAAGPIDPIDPFRGAYVMLDYPGLPGGESEKVGQVFVPLVADGDLWKGTGILRRRPAAPPYLACQARGYRSLDCGIDSLFLPEDKARRIQNELTSDRAAAVVKIDSQGNAAIVDLVSR